MKANGSGVARPDHTIIYAWRVYKNYGIWSFASVSFFYVKNSFKTNGLKHQPLFRSWFCGVFFCSVYAHLILVGLLRHLDQLAGWLRSNLYRMASLMWVMVGSLSAGVPNAARSSSSRPTQAHSRGATQKPGADRRGPFQVSSCVIFTEVLIGKASHMDKSRAVVEHGHLRVWIQEVWANHICIIYMANIYHRFLLQTHWIIFWRILP